jgi:membrane-associated PAP2 superfamily phosphatase
LSDSTPPTIRWPERLAFAKQPIPALLVATAALSLFFYLIPGVDLWFTRQFYDPEVGFPAARVPAFMWLRSFSAAINWTVLIVVIATVLAKLAMPERRILIPVRASLLLIVSYALATGLLVNGILKSISGRPRPADVVAFGGDHPFMAAWQFSDLCPRNCSFISGEGSSAAWLLAFILIVPARWRQATAIATIALASVLSLNRVAFGGHFLSDVLLSWALTLLVIAVVYHFLYLRPPVWLSEPVLEGGLARAGRALRGWVDSRIGNGGAVVPVAVPVPAVAVAEEPMSASAVVADAEPSPSADEAQEPRDATPLLPGAAIADGIPPSPLPDGERSDRAGHGPGRAG